MIHLEKYSLPRMMKKIFERVFIKTPTICNTFLCSITFFIRRQKQMCLLSEKLFPTCCINSYKQHTHRTRVCMQGFPIHFHSVCEVSIIYYYTSESSVSGKATLACNDCLAGFAKVFKNTTRRNYVLHFR